VAGNWFKRTCGSVGDDSITRISSLGNGYDAAMNTQEEEGDGLPNMRWRLRTIIASALVGLAAWAVAILLIR
jgi:hypothetical protein